MLFVNNSLFFIAIVDELFFFSWITYFLLNFST